MITILSKFGIITLTLLRWVCLLGILLTILGIARPYVSNISRYPYLQPIVKTEAKLNNMVKTNLPTKIAGYDLSRILTLIAFFIVMEACRNTIDKLYFLKHRYKMQSELQSLQKKYQLTSQKEKIALMESKVEQANLSNGKNRKTLLKEFALLKKELEKIGRDLAFLAIDVVDSTGMKVGEDPAIVEHDFHEYSNFIEAKFKEHGLIKAAWTPDGVMACFNSIEDAVQAAQDILHSLEYFNRQVKTIKHDFVLRCGINAGHVYYDDSIPLEKFSDRTIDIAGHMQKHAQPNSILIAKQMIEPVTNRERFKPTERIVDGLEVCQWDKEEKEKEMEKELP